MRLDAIQLKQFKDKYNKAIKDESESFRFIGQLVYVPFAKYVIEYNETI